MREVEVLSHDISVPSARTWNGLYTDDHLVIQRTGRSEFGRLDLRDDDILQAATQAWEEAGLVLGDKGEVRRATTFTAWGAVVRPDPGVVGVELGKRRKD